MRISSLAAVFVVAIAVVVLASSGHDQQESGKEWKSVVSVQRDPASGMCSLTARGSLLRSGKAKHRTFRLRRLCRYDSPAKTWRRDDRLSEDPIEIKIYNWQTEQTLFNLPLEVGLFWIDWSEDERVVSALAVSGPVQCNDIEIGEPQKGMVAACVPSRDSARAMFVPDPATHCRK